MCTFFLTGFLSVSWQFLAKFEVRERLAFTQKLAVKFEFGFQNLKTKNEGAHRRTGEKGVIKGGIYDYLCLSAAKKLSKTITFSDKKWSNVTIDSQDYKPRLLEFNFY